jgi:phospholipid/cholesterol/gamma-HCH transport system substrate-binding protein
VKFSKEIRVALLAIASGIILYTGFNFLKGVDLMSKTSTYYVTYAQIDGLTVSNPVMVNGLMVGRVSEITLDQEHDNRLLVSLEIDKEVKIGDSTIALLSNNSLLGSKAIKLTLGKSTTIYESGATLKGVKEQGLADVIAAKANPLIEHLDSVIIKVNDRLGAISGKELNTIVGNLVAASAELKTIMKDNGGNIQTVTGNLAQLSSSLVKTEAELKPMLAKFSALADSLNNLELKATVAKANQAMGNLSEITRKINTGEGTLGAMVTDKSLYNNLNKTLSDLDSLVVDLKYNPNHYFAPLGKKPKKKK